MKDAEKLEDRLVDFTVMVFKVSKPLPKSHFGIHITDQMSRSSLSAALNYAEARDAESRKDFIHKIRIVLKELRETMVALKIILKLNLKIESNIMDKVLKENNELISIFVKSVETAKKNTRGNV